jgi:hypothetical protein
MAPLIGLLKRVRTPADNGIPATRSAQKKRAGERWDAILRC